jgi:hypothetical protein
VFGPEIFFICGHSLSKRSSSWIIFWREFWAMLLCQTVQRKQIVGSALCQSKIQHYFPLLEILRDTPQDQDLPVSDVFIDSFIAALETSKHPHNPFYE